MNARIRKINESLMEACRRGLKDAVLLLLSRDADVNAQDMNGCTPLQEACHQGHADIVRLLLDHGANVNGWDDFGLTPLHYACVKGHTETVRALLEREIYPGVLSDILNSQLDPSSHEPPFHPEIVDMLRGYVPRGMEEDCAEGSRTPGPVR